MRSGALEELPQESPGWAARIAAALHRWRAWRLPGGARQDASASQDVSRAKLLRGPLGVATTDEVQDVLAAMALSECVYKESEEELEQGLQSITQQFGKDLVSFLRLQLSLTHANHQYLLAETSTTLFVAFIGTKKYRDLVADAQILHASVFSEDLEVELGHGWDVSHLYQANTPHNSAHSGDDVKKAEEDPDIVAMQPAVHAGFLARARGIPILQLYRQAMCAGRRLVLCGHSLGGAVAVISALSILRVLDKVRRKDAKVAWAPVHCITFGQPAVGNAALQGLVTRKGWVACFKSYVLKDDIVPRLLALAQLQRELAPVSQVTSGEEMPIAHPVSLSRSWSPDQETAPLALGSQVASASVPIASGPRMNKTSSGSDERAYWRLPRLVPLPSKPAVPWRWPSRSPPETTSDQTQSEMGSPPADHSSTQDASHTDAQVQAPSATGPAAAASASSALVADNGVSEEASSEVRPDTLSGVDSYASQIVDDKPVAGYDAASGYRSASWLASLKMPLYIPFGKQLLIGPDRVEHVSGVDPLGPVSAVRALWSELRLKFSSHRMFSYRSHLYRICQRTMPAGFMLPLTASSMSAPVDIPGNSLHPDPVAMHDHPCVPQQHCSTPAAWGHIAEQIHIRAAFAVVPIVNASRAWSWNQKDTARVRLQVYGTGLHLCNLAWVHYNLAKFPAVIDPPAPPPLLRSCSAPPVPSSMLVMANLPNVEKAASADSGSGLTVHCSSDFSTAACEVQLRIRRVRLFGLEGAGKTALFNALTGQQQSPTAGEWMFPDSTCQEATTNGVCYADAPGINMQDLPGEVQCLTAELAASEPSPLAALCQRPDLLLLVHNMAHKVPLKRNVAGQHGMHGAASGQPAVAPLLNVAAAAGIPLVLAITNKYAVTEENRSASAVAIMRAYGFSQQQCVVLNSRPLVVHGGSMPLAVSSGNGANKTPSKQSTWWRKPAPAMVLPEEGVEELRNVIHTTLLAYEGQAMQAMEAAVAAEDHLLAQSMQTLVASRQEQLGTDYTHSPAGAVAVGAAVGLSMVAATVLAVGSAWRGR